eukprot:scaffold1009_cov375-Prasinococcus_capsulatus_cf.AAC.7
MLQLLGAPLAVGREAGRAKPPGGAQIYMRYTWASACARGLSYGVGSGPLLAHASRADSL